MERRTLKQLNRDYKRKKMRDEKARKHLEQFRREHRKK